MDQTIQKTDPLKTKRKSVRFQSPSASSVDESKSTNHAHDLKKQSDSEAENINYKLESIYHYLATYKVGNESPR